MLWRQVKSTKIPVQIRGLKYTTHCQFFWKIPLTVKVFLVKLFGCEWSVIQKGPQTGDGIKLSAWYYVFFRPSTWKSVGKLRMIHLSESISQLRVINARCNITPVFPSTHFPLQSILCPCFNPSQTNVFVNYKQVFPVIFCQDGNFLWLVMVVEAAAPWWMSFKGTDNIQSET